MYKGQYIDMSYMASLSDGDHQFMRDMIETFLRDAPVITEKMTIHSNHEEWKPVGDLAHKFKTSLMFMGINSLHDTIRKIENSAHNDENKDHIPAMVEQVNDTCKHAITELKDFLEQLD